MNFGHCPICYDGYSSCRCTNEEYHEFYSKLEKEKQKYIKSQRKYYQKLLDESFDRFSTFECESFPMYFARDVFSKINKEEWLEIKKQFDKKFKI